METDGPTERQPGERGERPALVSEVWTWSRLYGVRAALGAEISCALGPQRSNVSGQVGKSPRRESGRWSTLHIGRSRSLAHLCWAMQLEGAMPREVSPKKGAAFSTTDERTAVYFFPRVTLPHGWTPETHLFGEEFRKFDAPLPACPVVRLCATGREARTRC